MDSLISVFDLYTAGYCMARGHVVKVVPVNGRSRFDFPASAQQAIDEFQRGEPISAALYADALRRLKKTMFSHSNTTSEVSHVSRQLK